MSTILFENATDLAMYPMASCQRKSGNFRRHSNARRVSSEQFFPFSCIIKIAINSLNDQLVSSRGTRTRLACTCVRVVEQ